MQFSGIVIGEDFAHFIEKCISNDGELSLRNRDISKPAFETLRVALENKHVTISKE